MDDKKAMYWLAAVKLAKQGNKEAWQELSEKNEVRKELKMPSVVEELRKALINEELKESKKRQGKLLLVRIQRISTHYHL